MLVNLKFELMVLDGLLPETEGVETSISLRKKIDLPFCPYPGMSLVLEQEDDEIEVEIMTSLDMELYRPIGLFHFEKCIYDMQGSIWDVYISNSQIKDIYSPSDIKEVAGMYTRMYGFTTYDV